MSGILLAIWCLCAAIVVAAIAICLYLHLLSTALARHEREERAEAGEPVGDWPHVARLGRTDPDRHLTGILDAEARQRGENLDGTPRRETLAARWPTADPAARWSR